MLHTKPKFGQIAAAGFVVAALVLFFAPCPIKAKVPLDSVRIYGSQTTAQKCLNNAWAAAGRRLQGPAIPNCLRMAFHDAGTYTVASNDGGANASILRELGLSQNAGLGICGGIINTIINDVRATPGCGLSSAADIIQIAGAVAVYLSGGPACPLMMGRKDRAAGQDSAAALPSACSNVAQLVQTFTNAGFRNVTGSLVVLSGAHNIGQSRATPQGPCSRGIGGMTRNNRAFDGHYYSELQVPPPKPNSPPPPGWFSSDNQLYSGGNAATRSLVIAYANNHAQFLSDWCMHYQEMSLLGVDASTNFGLMAPSSLPPRPPARR